jgi:dethiobiotin synthetase
MGVLAALLQRMPRAQVGYMKPVGQQHVAVQDSMMRSKQVDKDCLLAKKFFSLECDYGAMSPMLMPRGYTKGFIDGKFKVEDQEALVLDAWERMQQHHSHIVVEGTGHMGVGSIASMDNARVASLMGLDVVLVCEGGLGSAFDELSMNIAMCRQQDVNVRAVILNKVLPSKLEMLRDYFGRALEPHGIPLAGLVPHEPYLQSPSMMDIARLFREPFLSGEEHKLRHCGSVQIVTADVQRFKEKLASGEYQDKLLVIHGSRVDVALGILDHHRVTAEEGLYKSFGFQGGIVFTGTQCSFELSEDILERLRESSVPAVHAPIETIDAIAMIHRHTSKLNATDRQRTQAAVRHVVQHVDMNMLGLWEKDSPEVDARHRRSVQITDYL